jgi:hypothetical protein
MSLLLRLAAYYPDNMIAGILNRQGRKPTYGGHQLYVCARVLLASTHFRAGHVANLRRYHNIPRFEPSSESPSGEVLPVQEAAKVLGIAASTLHGGVT